MKWKIIWSYYAVKTSLTNLVWLLQEWGDPRKEEFYYYMKSYSPVDNVSIKWVISFIYVSLFSYVKFIFSLENQWCPVHCTIGIVGATCSVPGMVQVDCFNYWIVGCFLVQVKAQNYPEILITAGLNGELKSLLNIH